jgi:hypothetical protein
VSSKSWKSGDEPSSEHVSSMFKIEAPCLRSLKLARFSTYACKAFLSSVKASTLASLNVTFLYNEEPESHTLPEVQFRYLCSSLDPDAEDGVPFPKLKKVAIQQWVFPTTLKCYPHQMEKLILDLLTRREVFGALPLQLKQPLVTDDYGRPLTQSSMFPRDLKRCFLVLKALQSSSDTSISLHEEIKYDEVPSKSPFSEMESFISL